MMNNENIDENEEIVLGLLLEAIFMKYGYDFRDYNRAHIKRRVLHRMAMEGIGNITDVINMVLNDKSFFQLMLTDFSINVTEMFRDPSFYKMFRSKVIPILKSYSTIKIWHAGCSTGEEVYSMAIILKETGLYKRSQIYATDFSENAINTAKKGIYPISDIKKYTYNYQQSGGMTSFSDYYLAEKECVILDESLKERIIFAEHNLVTDGVFGEMNVILCRNVMIYFNEKLQNRVIKLFAESLSEIGFLCIGSKETLKYTNGYNIFDPFVEEERIYRKKY